VWCVGVQGDEAGRGDEPGDHARDQRARAKRLLHLGIIVTHAIKPELDEKLLRPLIVEVFDPAPAARGDDLKLGWIGSERPRMVAVQAEGCAPIVRAYEEGERHARRWEHSHTIAAGIRVPQAVGDFLILDAVRASGGFAIAVSDAAIVQAVDDAGRKEGLLLCPEGGATLAAYRKARAEGLVNADDRVLLFNCATGLKYPLADRSVILDTAAIDWASL